MNKIKQAQILIERLEEAGFEAYFVGGVVRDVLMSQRQATGVDELSVTTGVPYMPGDIDVTTNATPDEMKRVFADYKVIETGIKHGTVTVLATSQGADGQPESHPNADGQPESHLNADGQLESHPNADGQPVEITTYRTENDYSDVRHPDSVVFVRNLEEDLVRRDFTINAMAMDTKGRIIDLYGGRDDLDSKLIRAVGDPDVRFQEDALRIMRAMRFAATLSSGGFAVEAKTEAAMFRNKDLLNEISAERIYVELKKLIIGPSAGIVIRRYADILGVVMPELLALKGFAQHNPYHKYDVLEHCVRTLEKCHKNVPIAFAALLHDVGKPKTFSIDEKGIGHMYGHPIEGEKIARIIMQRLKADSNTTAHVCTLVKYHDLVFQKNEKLLKRWMNRYTPEILLEILQIKRADNYATGNMSADLAQKFDDVEQMIHDILDADEPFCLKDLAVNGRDLLGLASGLAGALSVSGEPASELSSCGEPARKSLGCGEPASGPWIGVLLDKLLEEVIDGKVDNKKEALLARAKELL